METGGQADCSVRHNVGIPEKNLPKYVISTSTVGFYMRAFGNGTSLYCLFVIPLFLNKLPKLSFVTQNLYG